MDSSVAAEPNIRVVKNATCTFCGCVCDDMELTVDLDQKRITKAKNACVLGKAWFAEHSVDESRPVAMIEGKEVSLDEAIDEAAKILVNARFPVIYGMSNSTSEAQRETVKMADLLSANVDSTSSVCHGPTGMGLQGVGEPTTTLGEVKNRADMIVYWGCNPSDCHPRLSTHYAVNPKGMYIPNGRKDRTVINVDVRSTTTTNIADVFVQVKPGSDFELLWGLRILVRGGKLNATFEEQTGVPIDVIENLASRLMSCNYGILFFGMGLTMTRGRHYNASALHMLATDLNEHTHFVVKPARGHGNVTGADTVMSWQTGYPFGINFNRGYPRHEPGEFTTTDIMCRGEADAACIIASDPMANFAKPAIDHMKKIPMISFDPKPTPTSQAARVAFTTACYGINTPGTVYRMDDIPIPLRPAFESPFPSDLDILKPLVKRIRELKRAQY